jgi:hypothetical protein
MILGSRRGHVSFELRMHFASNIYGCIYCCDCKATRESKFTYSRVHTATVETARHQHAPAGRQQLLQSALYQFDSCTKFSNNVQ